MYSSGLLLLYEHFLSSRVAALPVNYFIYGKNCFQHIHTVTKIPFMYSFSGNSAASALISTFMCL